MYTTIESIGFLGKVRYTFNRKNKDEKEREKLAAADIGKTMQVWQGENAGEETVQI